MKRQKLFIKYLILTAAMSLAYCSTLLAQIGNDSTGTEQRSLNFLSDTQSPMWFEKFFVKTHRNEEATKVILMLSPMIPPSHQFFFSAM